MINNTQLKLLSIGFIGGSLNSAVGYAHYVACKMDNKWSLEAGFFSNDKTRNQDTAELYGISPDRLYNNWQDLLMREKGRLDAIVILMPTPMHFEIVIVGLNEGYAVICEKSLATNSIEAEKILEIQTREKSFLSVIYNYSGYPMIRELRNKIRKGELGRILHFQAEMPQEGYIRVNSLGNKPIPQSWRLSDGSIPTIHLDLAVHLHQLVYYLIEQKPIKVISDQDSYGWFPEVVDNVNCLCRYSSGIMGNMWFSKSALGHRNGLKLRIYGERGSAEWYQACPEELVLAYSDGRREIVDRAASVEIANLKRYNRFKAGHPAGFIEAFSNLYSDIADSLQHYKSTGQFKSDNVFGAELSYDGLQFLEAMTHSVNSKTWVTVGGEKND